MAPLPINSEVRTISYENGEIQRVQLVRFDDWNSLDFIRPDYSKDAFDKVCNLYSDFIVPSKPWVFGQLVLFTIPDDVTTDFPLSSNKYGKYCEGNISAAVALRKSVKIINGKPFFSNMRVKRFWHELEKRDCIRIIRGNLPNTTILPVGKNMGFLSKIAPDAEMKVNSSFFTMDKFDCPTPYDSIGTPIGLMVKNGKIINPPLFSREALLVHNDGKVSIEKVDLNQLSFEINGVDYSEAAVYSRPKFRLTPKAKGTDIVICGRKVVAFKKDGNTYVPSSGFVLHTESACSIRPGVEVTYNGLEDVVFGLQVGNSIIVNGEKTEEFISPFYDIHKLWSTSYPPSLYPLDYKGARAPRIALGADKGGKPMLIWAEGPGKFGYDYGKESCGASLSEMAEIAEQVGMNNAINLDGGGSAQILLKKKRSLLISDRNKADNSEAERAIPVGLIIN